MRMTAEARATRAANKHRKLMEFHARNREKHAILEAMMRLLEVSPDLLNTFEGQMLIKATQINLKAFSQSWNV